MIDAALVRRLRRVAVAAVAAIAALVLVQEVALQWRVHNGFVRAVAVNRSGLRRTATMEVRYRAAALTRDRTQAAALRASLASLSSLTAELHDLSPATLAVLDDFTATAHAIERRPDDLVLQRRLGRDGDVLAAVFDVQTDHYARTVGWQRTALRGIATAVGAVILIGLAFLYAFVLKRRDDAVFALLEADEEQRQLFAAMFDNGTEMMALYDLDGQVVRANRSALERLGIAPENVARHYDEYVDPSEREAIAVCFRNAVAGHPTELASTFVAASGERIPVIANLSPVVVRDRVVGVVAAARDVTAERRAEAQLLHSHERFRSLFERSANAIGIVTNDGTIVQVNRALERLTGYPVEELVNESMLLLVPPARHEAAARRIADLTTMEGSSYRDELRARDGTDLPVEVRVAPIVVDGTHEGFFVSFADLTRDRALERRLAEKDDRLRLLYQVASSAERPEMRVQAALTLAARALGMSHAYLSEVVGDVVTIRRRFALDGAVEGEQRLRLHGTITERLRESPRALAVADLRGEPLAMALAEQGQYWTSFIGVRFDVPSEVAGALVFVDEAPHVFDEADLDFVDLVGSVVSGAVTRQVAEAALQRAASYDALTGAANRRLLIDHIDRACAHAQRTSEQFALHFVDLDGFKEINDAHGHEAGDEVLRIVSDRFRSVVRADDVLARIGGDEFVVLQSAPADPLAVERLSARLRGALTSVIPLPSGRPVRVWCSLGVAVYPHDGRTTSDLLRAADRAMYAEKRARAAMAQR
jgi:diguanylate cyclase (GGDEF)-like protein/PAS domain S-box-containing protein